MPTKVTSTHEFSTMTLLTWVGVILAGFFAFRWINAKTAVKAATTGGYVGGGSDSGADYGSDYYAPYGNQSGLLQQLLGALLGLKSSGGGSGGSKASSPNDPTKGIGSSSSNTGSLTDTLNSLKEGLFGNGDLQGGESNPLFGGDSLITASNLSAYDNNEPSLFTIPYQDANQQLTGFDNGFNDGFSIPYEDQNQQLQMTGFDIGSSNTGDAGTMSTGNETVFQIDPSDFGGGSGGGQSFSAADEGISGSEGDDGD